MRCMLVAVGFVVAAISAIQTASADPFTFGYGAEGAPGPWSGFYLGANGGKSWFDRNDQLKLTGIDNANDPPFSTFVSRTAGFHDDGSFGGGQLGYGFQRGV